MAAFANPFGKRDSGSYSTSEITTYKVLTSLTYLLSVVASIYYSVRAPHDGGHPHLTLWGQNWAHHTAFALNSVIVSVYFCVLFVEQAIYIYHLFSSNGDSVHGAASVGSHFIINNLLHFGFVMLFVRSHFWLAEILLIINFFNLSFSYFNHGKNVRFIHLGAVSGPLAATYVLLFTNGAIMFNAEGLVSRILANVAIWGILVYGLFFLFAYRDYTMGFNLSVLTAALGVGQFLRQVIAFQWIFAFTIMAALFVATVAIAIPGFGDKLPFHNEVVSEDAERAPLLADS